MKCCICTPIKNCGKYLDKIFQNMELMGSLFEEYVILIYYDVSNDDSLQKIIDFQKRNSRVFFYKNNGPLSLYRTHNIAKARNFCIEQIRQRFSDYEYFIMMDSDDVCCSDMNIDLLKRSIAREDWDALSFNKSYYYDTWAVSIKPYFVSFRHFDLMNSQLANFSDIIRNYVQELLKRLPSGELLQCCSAFCGFAIYRTSKFLNCKYDSRFSTRFFPKQLLQLNMKVVNARIGFFNEIERTPMEDCEHRYFHLEAIKKNNARIRISPEIMFL